MNAAKDLSVLLDAMPDHAALAMRAPRSERMDRAFETVEDVALPTHDDFKCLVIFIFADFAFSHNTKLFACGRRHGCGQHLDRFTRIALVPSIRRSETAGAELGLAVVSRSGGTRFAV
jgi:hypothetical protein